MSVSTEFIMELPFPRSKTFSLSPFLADETAFGTLFIVTLSLITFVSLSAYFKYHHDGIPTVNRTVFFEPDLFARLRWAVNAKRILERGNRKFNAQLYRLARGDMDILVLPHRYLTELNTLPIGAIESRNYHARAMLGHLTGLDVVRHTGHHVKVLLGRTTPALQRQFKPLTQRLTVALSRLFPQQTDEWSTMEVLEPVVHIVSEGIALVLFGTPICDEPEVVRLCFEHTKNLFIIVFVMRCVPTFLQPCLVWLLPARWRLARGWKRMSAYTFPEIERRKRSLSGETSTEEPSPDLLSWMIRDGEAAKVYDPRLLTQLAGSVAAGGTYSTANFICRCISDLTANPDVLVAVRSEIAAKHKELSGRPWTMRDVESLNILESAMKETSRLSQGAVITYSRVAEQEVTLSDNLRLTPGQFITISAYNRTMDPSVFQNPHNYNGFRFVDGDKVTPFRIVDNDVLGWGAGRWACPGRFVASIVAKSMLVKILDEYDFKFVNGREPPLTLIHEFGFWHPGNQMRVRRRKEVLGIMYEHM
ncbi:putative cytochrome P450 [Ustulina deusta]|nr:putative cytochrome P450 [Ustulina deusta]